MTSTIVAGSIPIRRLSACCDTAPSLTTVAKAA